MNFMIKDFLYPAKFLSTQLRSSGQTELKKLQNHCKCIENIKIGPKFVDTQDIYYWFFVIFSIVN
jgi:hypothetical protein